MATRTARPFSALLATTQDARVREALESLRSEVPSEVVVALELPESELPAVAEALNRIAESRREYEELANLPLSQRTAKQNARIRILGNRWENTAAGRGRAPGEADNGQFTEEQREDYTAKLLEAEREANAKKERSSTARAISRARKAAEETGLLEEAPEEKPAEVEPVSAVHESASKLPSTKEQRERIEALYDSRQVAEEKKRAPENFTKLGAARWINLLESHPLKEETTERFAAEDAARSEPKPRGRRSVTAKRVQPEEPDYAKMPARSRPKAKRDYQAALAAWKAAEESAAETTIEAAKAGLPVDLETGAKLAEAAKTAPKASTARRGRATSSDSFDPSDPKTRAEVVRLHVDDKLSMKAIAEKFGLPAVHKSWLAVSIVWREEADARGLDRPRYPERSKK